MRIAAAVIVIAACATCTTPTVTTTAPASSSPTLDQFASTLAAFGMSVAAPPRVCVPGVDEVSAPPTCDPVWNDDVGCVVVRHDGACKSGGVAGGDDARAVLLPYARQLVRAHVKKADDDGRGDALVDAYLRHDDARFKALALSVEADFDDARLKRPRSTSTRTAARDKPVKPVDKHDKHDKHGDVADAGPVDASAGHESGGGSVVEGEGGDAGPGGVITLKERLIGTWTAEDSGLRNIYAICDGGDYVVRYEMLDESLSEFARDMPVVHGKWAAHDGDPPTVELSALGESMTATITTLTDDALEISLEGEVVSLARRSKSASCD